MSLVRAQALRRLGERLQASDQVIHRRMREVGRCLGEAATEIEEADIQPAKRAMTRLGMDSEQGRRAKHVRLKRLEDALRRRDSGRVLPA
jgi:hypothetical protein